MTRLSPPVPFLALLLTLGLPACRSTPEVQVSQGKLIITGIDERITCFRISVKRQGVTEFGPPIAASAAGGESTITLGADPGLPITELRISVTAECVQQGGPTGDWVYLGQPLTLPPEGEVRVPWADFRQ